MLLAVLLLPLAIPIASAAEECNCSKDVIKDMVQSPLVSSFIFNYGRDYQWGYGMPVFDILDSNFQRSFMNCDFFRGPPWCIPT